MNRFVCVDGEFNRLQIISSKFSRIKSIKHLTSFEEKSISLLMLIVELPGSETITLYPFSEDTALLKKLKSALNQLFDEVDAAFKEMNLRRSSKQDVEAELKKYDPITHELVSLLIESKMFVNCQDLLQFSAKQQQIKQILMRWHKQSFVQQKLQNQNNNNVILQKTHSRNK